MSHEVSDPTGWIEPKPPKQPYDYIESCRYLTSDEAMMAVVTRGQSLFEEPTVPLFGSEPRPDTMEHRYRKREGSFSNLREMEGEKYLCHTLIVESNILVRGLKNLIGRNKPAIALIELATEPTSIEGFDPGLLLEGEFS